MIPTSRDKGTKKVAASVKNLEDQVLLHERQGVKDITVVDYYNRYIVPFSNKYSTKYKGVGSKVVCPFHEDVMPSMGVLEDSKRGVQIFNCFGCGAKGTVITLHERFCKELQGIEMGSHVDYVKSLANMYGLVLDEVQTYEEVTKDDSVNFNASVGYNLRMHQRNVSKIRMVRDSLSLDDFKRYWDELGKRMVLNMSKK